MQQFAVVANDAQQTLKHSVDKLENRSSFRKIICGQEWETGVFHTPLNLAIACRQHQLTYKTCNSF